MNGHWMVLTTGMMLPIFADLILRSRPLNTLGEKTVAVQGSSPGIEVQESAGHEAHLTCVSLATARTCI
jgi:hypothetical protein